MHKKILNRRILLIESDQEFSKSIGRLLKKEKYEVSIYSNLEQAISDLSKKRFGTIIFGLNQPISNSINSLHQLQAIKNIPEIIILSSFNLNEIQSDFQPGLVKNILIKPIKKETFLDCISSIKTFA